jgi:XTP/dITP diphosphohydrolase
MAQVTAHLCSQNAHKLQEFRALFPDWELTLLDAATFPAEDGATYHDNARSKALFGREVGPDGAWMLGDDSGLELDALAGGPGVATARWAAGEHVAKALAAVDGAASRRGRYVCELVCLAPDAREFRGTGVLEGTIAAAPSGREGFGFDAVFVPDGETRTVAELGNDWKSRNSHRARAAQALLAAIG